MVKIIPNVPLLPVFIVHGFNSHDDGAGTVDKIGKYVPDLNTTHALVQFDYGWTGLSTIIKKNKQFATNLMNMVAVEANPTTGITYAIGHSNGCAIIVEAARQGAEFKRVLLINPALPINTKFPDTIGEVLVVYTKHDKATKAAMWAKRIPFLRRFIPVAWGGMGTYGSKYCTFDYNLSEWLDGHSDLFKDHNLEDWGKFLCTQLTTDVSYYGRMGAFEKNKLNLRIVEAQFKADDADTSKEPQDVRLVGAYEVNPYDLEEDTHG